MEIRTPRSCLPIRYTLLLHHQLTRHRLRRTRRRSTTRYGECPRTIHHELSGRSIHTTRYRHINPKSRNIQTPRPRRIRKDQTNMIPYPRLQTRGAKGPPNYRHTKFPQRTRRRRRHCFFIFLGLMCFFIRRSSLAHHEGSLRRPDLLAIHHHQRPCMVCPRRRHVQSRLKIPRNPTLNPLTYIRPRHRILMRRSRRRHTLTPIEQSRKINLLLRRISRRSRHRPRHHRLLPCSQLSREILKIQLKFPTIRSRYRSRRGGFHRRSLLTTHCIITTPSHTHHQRRHHQHTKRKRRKSHTK